MNKLTLPDETDVKVKLLAAKVLVNYLINNGHVSQNFNYLFHIPPLYHAASIQSVRELQCCCSACTSELFFKYVCAAINIFIIECSKYAYFIEK